MTETIAFTDFAPRHLPGALRLSQQAGWPHRMQDWDLILRLSRGVVALEAGKVVATALATPFGDVATANMIIVDAAMRGRGLGRKIVERALACAQPREWRLIATADGLPLYEKLGFVAYGEILQHQGPLGPVAAPEGVSWAEDAFDAIEALDRKAFGAERAGLIALMGERGRLAVLRDGADITGYAAIREFGRGRIVGPVAARSAGEAQRLMAFLLSAHEGEFLRIDIPAGSGLAPWLTSLGLENVGGGIAMRRGPAAPQSDCHLYALAAQALG